MDEPVVVVGAGLAAVSCATTLRDSGHTGPITIVGDEAGLPYDRPPLSKAVLAGQTPIAEVDLHPATWYAERAITVVPGLAATAIDPDAATVTLADGRTLPAGVIVLATGGRPRTLTVDGADHPAVHLLRTRDHAERLRTALTPGARVLIVGAGLIGAEVTATASALGCRVTLVDPNPLPLGAAIGVKAATHLHRAHHDHGVTLHQTGLDRLTPGPVGGLRATLGNGETVDADVVLAGIGITPSVELAEAAGIPCDHGVLVNTDGRTGHPRVWAVGDVARRTGPDGPQPRVEHWDGALRSGERAGRAIAGAPAPPPRAPWFWTDRYGTHLEMIGHLDPGADLVERAGDDGFTHLYIKDGHLVGAVTLDRSGDARSAQRLIDRAVPVSAAVLADATITLRSLL